MMSTFTSGILILYSNPSDTSRIRLDKEHRAIDQVIHNVGLDTCHVTRLHATSVADFVAELQKGEFEIIQFSGHGSPTGLYLESSQIDASEEVSAKRVAAILQDASPRLKAVIFVSCFSTTSIPDLIDAAPYLITISGPANDDSAIEFIKRFYEAYFRHGSIEAAFELAVRFVGSILEKKGLYPVLSRRAKEKGEGRFLVQVYPSGSDSILIDLTDVGDDFTKLRMTKDEFLSLLTRKIRAHQWIFSIPREKVVLPIGPYFGVFSWQNASDKVVCNRILQVKEDVNELTCRTWARLVLNYNDLFSAKYRSTPRPADAINSHLLQTALNGLQALYNDYLLNEIHTDILRNVLGRDYKTSIALIEANIQLAKVKFSQTDYSSTILYLESALSAVHDLVDGLTNRLCE